ncbi:ribulose-phosphate 3-epimerase [Tindallia californiensis]|uniref:Ribulose-phosphate 3-epimerase n=1 Tax=Tindallia californiensis TaxID=159292 RepID=A0A1H3NU65_9FIRM|nr:ribulose-phosphate 3-epimerase [Tindallia californiensis]SDY92476.1 ribulose-phosphate 3-epimerase [Tindallia californiensis]
MKLIAPSILAADFANLNKSIKMVEEAGCDMLHIDVMDGRFVPNITIGPVVIESLRKVTGIPFDIHLMIVEPEKYIETFIEAGADMITVQAEACVHLDRIIQQIKSTGAKVGVALNPSTPEHMLEYVLDQLDMVLVMSVNPGFGGQEFINGSLRKITNLKAMIEQKSLNVKIQVDGGINQNNINKISQAGADIFVAGSAIFNSTKPTEAVKHLRAAAMSEEER